MGSSLDVAVVGAGFGGLGAALALAERGIRVGVFEQLNYPGGCASTFTKHGYRFESGATLFSGFAKGQLFEQWIRRYELPVEVDEIDPLVTLRTSTLNLRIGREPKSLQKSLEALPAAPVHSLQKFFNLQKRVADALWPVLETPELLPPWTLGGLVRHALHLHKYIPVISLIGQPLGQLLKKYQLENYMPLRVYLDALCQITLQCSAEEAEAPFALAAMDYYYRGTGHVRGGIGQLAEGLVKAIQSCGGEVHLAERVKALTPLSSGGWQVQTRKRAVRVPWVVTNVLPQNLGQLMGMPSSEIPKPLGHRADAVASGWGAAMLYFVVEGLDNSSAHHLELVADDNGPLTEGRHVFCSVGSKDEQVPDKLVQTVTASTHIPMSTFLPMDQSERGKYIAEVQENMHSTIQKLAPEIIDRSILDFSASPRTFERFTGRANGFVGGIPRRAGLRHYFDMWPHTPTSGIYMVGDSVFPGQSTLATAMGGVKVAEQIAKKQVKRVQTTAISR